MWWKFTKPHLSGYDVSWSETGHPTIHNALPLDYLLRLERQNRLFGDDIRYRGLWKDSRGAWRIVTTQPHVSGPPADMDEIATGMASMGFRRLRWDGVGYEASQGWRIGRMCVWDLHPGNVVLCRGLVVPVDVIVTPLPEDWPPCHFHGLAAVRE